MKRALLIILLLSTLAFSQTQSPSPTAQGGRFIAANYGQWEAQVMTYSSGVACVQPITFTLPDGSSLKPWATNASLIVGQETVTPTAFDYQSHPGWVCISATFASPHFSGDPVSSGTFGLQEAINVASARGGGAVTIDQNWVGLGGTTAIKNAASTPGNVGIEDVRTSAPTGGGGGTPAGPSNAVQVNVGGAFGGNANLTATFTGGSNGNGALVENGDVQVGGQYYQSTVGGTQWSGAVQLGTSVTVPTSPFVADFSLFLGSDNVFRCQLRTGLGGGQCLTFASLGGVAATAQIPDLSPSYVQVATPGTAQQVGQPNGVAPLDAFGLVANSIFQGPTPVSKTANYTFVPTDRGDLFFANCATACTFTLPQAGTTGFQDDYYVNACNVGPGTLTITPTTSTISYTNGVSFVSGVASVALGIGQCANVTSDNTNYWATVHFQFTQGTLTASNPFISHSVTWNSGTTAFTNFQSTITCTAAAAASTALSFVVGATTQFGLSFNAANCASPYLTVPAGTSSFAGISFQGTTLNSGISSPATGTFDFLNGVPKTFAQVSTGLGYKVNNSEGYCFSNNATDATTSNQVCLDTPAANVVEISTNNTGDATTAVTNTLRGMGVTTATTNGAGGNLIFQSGPGTGNAAPSQIVLQAPNNLGVTGTVVQTQVDRFRVGSIKTLSTTSGTATAIIAASPATLQIAGGTLFYTIRATDGVDVCALTGSVNFSLVNKAATFTGVVSSPVGETKAASGTACTSFSTTWAFSTNTLQATPTWAALTPTTIYMTYTVVADGDVNITPQ